jgi:hypothetical protein
MGAIYTVELSLGVLNAGGVYVEQKEYLSTARFNTSATDLPAQQHFHDALLTPANFERSMFQAGATTGVSTIGYGEIVVVNADGRYDYWAAAAFSGRDVIIKAVLTDYRGLPIAAYKDTPILIKGKIDTIDLTDAFTRIRLKMYDRMSDLDKPLLTTRYAGTTLAGGQGAEGTADLKDTFKPKLYGTKHNLIPVQVNAYDLIYQVSTRPLNTVVVYDGGLGLINDADYTTVAAMVAAKPAAGHYVTAKNLGLFKIGGAPAFQITCDASDLMSGSPVDMCREILLDAGFSLANDVDVNSMNILYAKTHPVAGYWVSDDRTIITAVSDILRSISGYLLATSQGVFQFGRLELPSGTPIAAFKEWMCKDGDKLQRLTPGDSNRGVPVYKITLRYDQLGTAQAKTDLAGAVSVDRQAYLANEWKSAVAQNDAVKAAFFQSPEMTFDTCLMNQADALAEAQRLLAIYSSLRNIWRFKVHNSSVDFRADQSVGTALGLSIDLGSLVTLQASRFLLTPKLLLVIGRVDDCENNSIQFDLWG